MKKGFLCMVILMALALIGDVAYSQGGFNSEAELVRNVIRAERRLAIFKVMDLTESEKTGFWSLYDEYIARMDKTNDRMVALIHDFSVSYNDISNEKALKMLNELISIDMEKLNIKSEYIKKFETILPGVKVARFFQIENKLDVQRDLNFATQIPLLGGIKDQQEQQQY